MIDIKKLKKQLINCFASNDFFTFADQDVIN